MDIKFIDTSPLTYETELIKAYEAITGRTLNPADPERLIVDLLTYAITLCAINIDETGRMNLLATAKGEYLDRLGELVGCVRLPAQKAKASIRFSISEPLDFDVVIPQGTAVGADDENIFYTTQEAMISAGSLYVDVMSEYKEAGSKGNGFAVGQINKLLYPIAYVSQAENISMSMYGADLEEDDRFRERIRESLERFSCAGSRESYIYYVKSAHQDIADVQCWSSSPGVVKITFLMKDGAIPDDSMLQLVYDSLSDEKVRPLTDSVVVEAPVAVNYSIDLVYYIDKGAEALTQTISKNVSEKVYEFVSFTKKLGKDILPEKLIEMIMSIKGIHSVDIISPQRQALDLNQFGVCENISIAYGGMKY